MSTPTNYGTSEPLEIAGVVPVPKSPKTLPSQALALGRRLLTVKTEVLSGVTTGIAQVPEAVGFSFAAGVPPVFGLYSSWIVGIVMSVLGARPAQIYGTAGSMVVVMAPLVRSHGIGHLFYAIMLSGIFQAGFGLLGLARLMKLIPSSAMSGFCNGLAVLIAKAQFNNFKVPARSGHGHHGWVSGETAGIMAVYVVIVMAVMTILPKYSKAVPSSLIGILVCMTVEHGMVRPAHSFTYLISDLADVSGDLPSFVWLSSAFVMPPLNGDTFAAVAPLAAILAVIAIVETLLTKRLLDTTLNDGKGSDTRETIAQGAHCVSMRPVCVC
jgi:sulfate permease, SulP family